MELLRSGRHKRKSDEVLEFFVWLLSLGSVWFSAATRFQANLGQQDDYGTGRSCNLLHKVVISQLYHIVSPAACVDCFSYSVEGWMEPTQRVQFERPAAVNFAGLGL